MSQKRKNNVEIGSQIIKKSRASDSENDEVRDESKLEILDVASKEAEIGIIESVQLKNFMCHTRLDFKFGPNVNFIVGKNGSGKSAVMTAVIVGLGGSASKTNRGASLKNFIMNGKQAAEVTIVLRNSGPDSYKKEEYGDRIVVERRFHMSGHTSYKLKGENGNIVSTKRDDLIGILDAFNIQVDNPICILNQDASRTFLNSKNPKSKYELFVKATQLEQMVKDYEFANCQRVITCKLLKRKTEGLKVLEKEVDDWKQKHEFQQTLDELHAKRKRLTLEMAWAEFANVEQDLEEEERKLTGLQSATPKFTEKVDIYHEKLQDVQKAREEIENEIQDVNLQMTTCQQKIADLKSELNLKRQIHRNAALECQKLSASMKNITKDRDLLKKRIKDIQSIDTEEQAAEKQLRLERIQNLDDERLNVEAKCETVEHHCSQLKNAVTRGQEEIYTLRNEEQGLRTQLDRKKRSLADLEGSRSNHMRRFGNWVPDLLARIESNHREGRFRQKPRGPLGAHIKLRDAKWNVAIESCIGALLHAYYCDNSDDARLLEKLYKEVNRNGQSPIIVIGKFAREPYNVDSNRVQSSNYVSLIDMLDVDDYLVANCLIDQRKIENVLLIADNSEARHAMQQNVPRNCRETFTACGDQVYPSPNFRYYSARNTKANILQENVEATIRAIQEECATISREHGKIKEKLDCLSSGCRNDSSEAKNAEREIMRLQQTLQRIKREIAELQAFEEPEAISTSSMEEDLQNFEVQLNNYTEDLQKAKDTFKTTKEESVAALTNYEVAEEEMTAIVAERVGPLKESLSSNDSAIEKATTYHQHYVDKLRGHETAVSKQEKTCETRRRLVAELRINCEETVGPRVTQTRPLDKIQREVNVITKRLENEERLRGDPQVIQNMYYETNKKYMQIKGDVVDLDGFINRMDFHMAQRLRSYQESRQFIAIRIRQFFITMLGHRQYKGDIQFDHDNSILNITVQPRPNSTEETRDVRGLSGGERSFSTVSFILSLWEAMESPFRMMDEFDVFMDMVNRRICMDIMLDNAKSKSRNQFIFLTPLDMTKLRASRMIRIFRMSDPDRNQGILPFASTSGAVQEDEQEDEDD